jgi:hypothetical protein
MLALNWRCGNHALLAGAFAVLVASVFLGAPCAGAARAEPGPAAIVAPAEWRIAAGAEVPVGIEVRTGPATPSQLMLLIRGLPETIALSHGRLFESGVWALRIADLPTLKIVTRRDALGSSELFLSLVGVDGTVLSQARATLTISAQVAQGEPKPAKARPTAAPLAPETTGSTSNLSLSLPPLAAQPASPEAKTEAVQLVTRGDENLKTGKIVAARKFYERAAELGSAQGALALARTYDPQELAKIAVIGGIGPDLELARIWYERARDMGLAEAADGLQRISNRQ